MPCKSKSKANSKVEVKKRPLENDDMMENEHNKENNEEQQSVKKKVQDTSNKKRTKQESPTVESSESNTNLSRSRLVAQPSAKSLLQDSNAATTTKTKKKTTEASSTEDKTKRKQSPSPSHKEPIKKTKAQLAKAAPRITTTPVTAKNIRHRSVSSSSITTATNKKPSSPKKTVTSKSRTTKVIDVQPPRSKSSMAARSTRLMNTTRRTIRRQTTYLPVPSTVNGNIKGGQVLAVGENGMTQLGLKSSIDQRKNPQPVLIPEPIVQIAAGPLHSVCLTDKNNIYTFGCNDENALGRLDNNDDDDDDIDPFGEVDLSEILSNDEESIVQIVAGDSHTVVLSNMGKVYGRFYLYFDI